MTSPTGKCARKVGECKDLVPVGQEWAWEKVEVAVGTGAVDTVGPASVAQGLPTKPTYASTHGCVYHTANGGPIPNEGEKELRGFTDGWQPVATTMQVAGVKQMLGSVRRICAAGNKVVC